MSNAAPATCPLSGLRRTWREPDDYSLFAYLATPCEAFGWLPCTKTRRNPAALARCVAAGTDVDRCVWKVDSHQRFSAAQYRDNVSIPVGVEVGGELEDDLSDAAAAEQLVGHEDAVAIACHGALMHNAEAAFVPVMSGTQPPVRPRLALHQCRNRLVRPVERPGDDALAFTLYVQRVVRRRRAEPVAPASPRTIEPCAGVDQHRIAVDAQGERQRVGMTVRRY